MAAETNVSINLTFYEDRVDTTDPEYVLLRWPVWSPIDLNRSTTVGGWVRLADDDPRLPGENGDGLVWEEVPVIPTELGPGWGPMEHGKVFHYSNMWHTNAVTKLPFQCFHRRPSSLETMPFVAV